MMRTTRQPHWLHMGHGLSVATATLMVTWASTLGCSSASTGTQSKNGGGTSTDAGGATGADASAPVQCAQYDTSGCVMQVCPTASDCAGSGLSPMSFPCIEPLLTMAEWSLTSCAMPNEVYPYPEWIVDFPQSAVTTYTFENTEANVISCYLAGPGTLVDGLPLPGPGWYAGAGLAEDGGALGSFTLTFTSVTNETTVGGQPIQAVHGSFQAQCVGVSFDDASAPPPGTIVVSGTF
jgi:hypothetical protein